ncbi:metal-dependent hydrolase [bacterium]|jgi:L-ascorbate metabolism protein UlaG (beta-lactamase superfamily)|nr:metal-dependent hydrolase [bacterium]
MVDLKYIGHSAFIIKNNDKAVIIDPWVEKNEKFNWHDEPITDILLTHAHSDHLGNAIEIAKEKEIEITAVAETAAYLEKKGGVKAKSIGLGAWINYSWGRAVFVPAFHSNSLPNGNYGGCAASIILDIDGVRIFHAGDTCLTGEMKTIKELYAPQIALLPIGGTYTMDVDHAAMAAKWLGARTVIPMHYGTFPEIEADLQRFAQLIAVGNTNCQILDPNTVQ